MNRHFKWLHIACCCLTLAPAYTLADDIYLACQGDASFDGKPIDQVWQYEIKIMKTDHAEPAAYISVFGPLMTEAEVVHWGENNWGELSYDSPDSRFYRHTSYYEDGKVAHLINIDRVTLNFQYGAKLNNGDFAFVEGSCESSEEQKFKI